MSHGVANEYGYYQGSIHVLLPRRAPLGEVGGAYLTLTLILILTLTLTLTLTRRGGRRGARRGVRRAWLLAPA